jgi:hypothetical protein
MYEGLSVFYGRTCDVNEETGEREGSDACCVVMRAGGSAGVGERGKKKKREGGGGGDKDDRGRGRDRCRSHRKGEKAG